MNDWTIRLAERRDVNELLGLEQAQFPEPWTKNMLLDEITNTETRRYTVAVRQGAIVGYLGVMFVLDELHVNTIGTLPGFEGRGVATSLMDDAWRDARERGVVRATLEVAASNQWGSARTTTHEPARTRWCCGPTSWLRTHQSPPDLRWTREGPRHRDEL